MSESKDYGATDRPGRVDGPQPLSYATPNRRPIGARLARALPAVGAGAGFALIAGGVVIVLLSGPTTGVVGEWAVAGHLAQVKGVLVAIAGLLLWILVAITRK